MKYNLILLILLNIMSAGILDAQTISRFMNMGDQAFSDGDYYTASVYYLKAVKEDSLRLNNIIKLADACRMFNNYNEASYWYSIISKKDTKVRFPEARFWNGVMLCNQKLYKEALDAFNLFNEVNSDKKSPLIARAIQEIKSCEWALSALHDSIDAIVLHLPKQINTSYNEFNPLQLKDSVFIFSSIRLDQESDPKDGILPGTYLSQLFESKITPAGLSKPLPLPKQINESGFHNSNICISSDLKHAFFSRCEDLPGPLRNCGLYQAKFRNGKWQKAIALDERFNMSAYTTTQPYLAHGDKEDILFFVSDRPGGLGGKDIWYAILKKSRLFDPVNLGTPVNTPGDEITPFYHTNSGQLYFSSDWFEGYGGFDIFRSKGSYNQWSVPENIRQPYNSEANDLYFIINSDDSSGYFTSNRQGSYFIKSTTCCNDNYSWHFRPAKIETPPLEAKTDSVNVEMQVKSFLPLSLYFHNDIPKPVVNKESTNLSYNTTLAEYYLLKDKYVLEYTKGLQAKDKTMAGREIQDFFDKEVVAALSKLDTFSGILLQDLENGTDVTLTVSGFASPLNSDEYNKLLSKRRISSLINYLNEYKQGQIKKFIGKIDPDGGRLNIVEVPLGEEKSNPKVSDNPKDLRNSIYSLSAALERKIQITGYIRKESRTVQSQGPTTNINPAKPFTNIKLNKEFLDLGSIRNGSQLSGEILLTNTGTNALRIFAMETSCGCTLVDWPKDEIPAGKSATLKIYFNSRNKSGEQFENVTIKANIPEGEKTIVIRAFVK